MSAPAASVSTAQFAINHSEMMKRLLRFAALVISDRRQERVAPDDEDPGRRRGVEAFMAVAALALSAALAAIFTAVVHGISH